MFDAWRAFLQQLSRQQAGADALISSFAQALGEEGEEGDAIVMAAVVLVVWEN